MSFVVTKVFFLFFTLNSIVVMYIVLVCLTNGKIKTIHSDYYPKWIEGSIHIGNESFKEKEVVSYETHY